jgi:hypothetical protein
MRGQKPSDVPTEVSRKVKKSEDDLLPSDVPTEAVRISDDDGEPGQPKVDRPELVIAREPQRDVSGELGRVDGDAEEEDR